MTIEGTMKTDFEVGGCYFLVGYMDQRLTIPYVRPLLFCGSHSTEEGQEWLFCDVDFLEEQKPDLKRIALATAPTLFANNRMLEEIFDWPGLVRELQRNLEIQASGRTLDQVGR